MSEKEPMPREKPAEIIAAEFVEVFSKEFDLSYVAAGGLCQRLAALLDVDRMNRRSPASPESPWIATETVIRFAIQWMGRDDGEPYATDSLILNDLTKQCLEAFKAKSDLKRGGA